jgi:dipeptidyl aminopeptidase/acylaminoacyl peptidase
MTTPVSELDTSTLRTLIASPVETPALTVIGPAEAIADETAQAVSYTSGGLTITGVIRTPEGAAPMPAVVVVHGSVNPDKYESGGDILPEQRALLAAGYIVFAPDLRGYAGSDAADTADTATVDPGFGWDTVLDWGMALDVVNALRLVRNGAVAGVDTSRVGLMGHSLGGLLVLDAAVIAPGLSDLVVALSAPSSDFAELMGSMSAEEKEQFETSLPTDSPANDPDYWADVSPRTFFDRATEPLFLLHGGADDTTLPQWSEDTAAAWRAVGLEAQAVIIDGADHHFKPHRDEADAAIVQAFDAVIGPGG